MAITRKLTAGVAGAALAVLTANQFILREADTAALKDVFKGESQAYAEAVTTEARAGRCAELEGHLADHCNQATRTLASLDKGGYLDMSLNHYKVFFK